jgi:hypothetical protein
MVKSGRTKPIFQRQIRRVYLCEIRLKATPHSD